MQPNAPAVGAQQQQKEMKQVAAKESSSSALTELRLREQARVAKEREELDPIIVSRKWESERARPVLEDNPAIEEDVASREDGNNDIANLNLESSTGDEDVNMVTERSMSRNKIDNQMIENAGEVPGDYAGLL